MEYDIEMPKEERYFSECQVTDKHYELVFLIDYRQ